jgi:hypothetical protein
MSERPRMPPLEQIETLYHQALLIGDVIARGQWLADRCGADMSLSAEIESLLEAHYAMVYDSGSSPAAETAAIPMELVWPLLRCAVSGTRGHERGLSCRARRWQVWPAMISGAALTEGQFLAALRHPHITNLLGAGVSASGHPFLTIQPGWGVCKSSRSVLRH